MSRLAYTALFAALALAACTRAPLAPPAPPAPPVAPAAVAPPAEPQPAKQALSVTGADLGTELGADGRVVTAKDNFASSDTIIVAITTTNTGSAPVNAQLTARWIDPDGGVLNEESRQQDFSGTSTLSFRIADPKGLKKGKYKLEVALNGSTVQTREFSVN